MKSKLLVLVVVAVAAAAPLASTATAAAQVDQQCQDAGNGATTCQTIVRETVSGPTGSGDVIACLGEDVFVNLDVQVVAHETFRPDGSVEQHENTTIHGDGYGLVTGVPVLFNQTASANIDNLPDGGMILHQTSPAEVVTQGGAPNLELTVELQVVIAPDGSVTNEQVHVQAHCGG